MDRKGSPSNKDNHDLPSDNDKLNADEKVIPKHTFEDVQLIVKTPIVVLIEDLHPNKGVKNHSLELVLFSLRLV